MSNLKDDIGRFIKTNWETAKQSRRELINKLCRTDKCICIFGAGVVGRTTASTISQIGIRIDFFCDNNKALAGHEIFNGIKCITVDELIEYRNNCIIIIATRYFDEISKQLRSLDFPEIYITPEYSLRYNDYWDETDALAIMRNVYKTIDILADEQSKHICTGIVKNWFRQYSESPLNYLHLVTDDQYFTSDIIHLLQDEVFVDAGAFNGDTVLDFISHANEKFKHIFAYELDKANFKDLRKNISRLEEDLQKNITLYNLGLLDENKFIKYNSNSSGTCINDSAEETGEVVLLSDHLEGQKVTFIKMDIEGAEVLALKGAERIIREHKPKLAICVYHRPDHLWEIPLYIKSLVPEYRVFLRHHAELDYDIVCYATL
jgi:FkbM family methyltransferase